MDGSGGVCNYIGVWECVDGSGGVCNYVGVWECVDGSGGVCNWEWGSVWMVVGSV